MKSRWSRAFRDVLADLLPLEHSWAPTLRIADFELLPWIYSAEAEPKTRELLAGRLEQPPRTRGVSSATTIGRHAVSKPMKVLAGVRAPPVHFGSPTLARRRELSQSRVRCPSLRHGLYGAGRRCRAKPTAASAKLHKRLHSHRTFDNEQVVLNENAPTCGAFAEPSSGLEPETPSLPWRCSTN